MYYVMYIYIYIYIYIFDYVIHMCVYTYIHIYIYIYRKASPHKASRVVPSLDRQTYPQLCHIGFSHGTLERRCSRIMLPRPQNIKPYLGHEG